MSQSTPAKPVLTSSRVGSLPFDDFLAAIAAKTPTPGGGAVACAAGALSAALAGMVVAYSIGKKDLAAHQGALQQAASDLSRARGMLMELGEEDASAYGLLNELQRLPEGDARKARELPGATMACVHIPLAAVAACEELARRCRALVPITNRHLKSDLAVAAILSAAAAEGGACNVRINLPLLSEEGQRAEFEKTLSTLLAHTSAHCDAVKSQCA